MSSNDWTHIARALRGALVPVGLVACALVACSTAARATDYRWNNIAGGPWSSATSWQPAGFPASPADSAHVPPNGWPCAIDLDLSPNLRGFYFESPTASLHLRGFGIAAVNGLRNAGRIVADAGFVSVLSGTFLNQAGGTCSVEPGAVLLVNGTPWTNDGTIEVNGSSSAHGYLRPNTHATVSGAGSIRLGSQDYATLDSPSGWGLTNGFGHTIRGTGLLSAPLANLGLVSADASGQTLRLFGSNKLNSGMLQATGGGRLRLESFTLANAGGRIVGNGGDVEVASVGIGGGTLATAGASAITILPGNSYVADVRNEGALRVAADGVLQLAGSTFTNLGTVTVHTGGTTPAALRMIGHVTASGGGSIALTDPALSWLDSPSGYVLTNAADHTIRGTGLLSAPLVNQGLVTADASGRTLRLYSTSKVNTGTFSATGGGRLRLDTFGLSNAGGRILAGGGDVDLVSVGISNGTLATTGANAITILPGYSYLADVRNEGALRVAADGVLQLAGSTFANLGTVTVHTGGTTAAVLRLIGHVTAYGGGSIALTDPALSWLDSPSGYVLTNAADHTIRGTGQLSAPLANLGLVSADVSGQTLRLFSSNKSNSGTLQATGGGRLLLDMFGLSNAGGRIVANGGDVEVSSVGIGGGTLSSTGKSVITVLPGSSYVQDVRNEGALRVAADGVLQLAGSTFANLGTVTVHTGGTTAAVLRLIGHVTAYGGGSIALADSSLAWLDSPSGWGLMNGPGHTIRGTGQLSAPLANYGTVRADVPAHALRLNGWGKLNDGSFEAIGGGELRLEVAPNNYNGYVHQLTGGLWRAGAGSTLRLPGCPIDTNAAWIVLEGEGSRLVLDAAGNSALDHFVRNAIGSGFTIRDGRDFDVPGAFSSSGFLVVGRGSEFRVGATGTSDYVQTSTGYFHAEIGGRAAGEHGRLIVSGVARIDGGLHATLVGGFMPVAGDTFAVMTFTSRTGDFRQYGAFTIGNGLYFVPEWRPHSLVLRVVTTPSVDAPPTETPRPQALSFRVHGGSLALELPEEAQVEIALFDAAGRRVATPVRGFKPAGRHEYPGRELVGAGGRLANGLYLARAQVTCSGRTRVLGAKLLVLR